MNATIGLGFRLATAGGRRCVVALVLTATAVAMGTALLLLALTVEPAYNARTDRSELFFGGPTTTGAPTQVRPERYTAVRTVDDAFGDLRIHVLDIAGVGTDPPRPAGLVLPAPGEVLVSPALAELAAREPLLAQRYPPGSRLLPDSVVPVPESLLAVRGAAAPSASDERWTAVLRFPSRGEERQYGPVVRLVIVIGAVAMLAPVVIFVATATRLTAAARERRMAALRLAGATSGQVSLLAGVEALLTGVLGAAAGLGLFFAVRPLAVYVTIDDRWYVSDLTPTPAGFAVALIGVPLAAVLGAQLALARVAISPLGVGRRGRARPLRIWRVLPLVAALPLFAVLVLSWDGGDPVSIMASFVLVLGSMLLAGPWLARALGEVLARTGSAAAVLAGRRLTGEPRAGFRAVSGAVVGTFVAAMFLTLVPAVQTGIDPAASSGLARDAAIGYADDADEAQAALRALAAVAGLTTTPVRVGFLTGSAEQVWIGDCAAIARLTGNDPALCGPGRILVTPATRDAAGIEFGFGTALPVRGDRVAALAPGGFDRPAMVVPLDSLDGPVPADLGHLLGVSGPPDAIEQARTALVTAGLPVLLSTPILRTGAASEGSVKFERVLLAAMFGTFVVAGCSAAVAAATGLLERRRSFALLRLGGTPLGVLRRSTVLELALPLVATSLASASLGVLTARLIGLGGGVDQPVPWTTLGGPLAVGVSIALLLGCLALPLVRRVTGGEATRIE